MAQRLLSRAGWALELQNVKASGLAHVGVTELRKESSLSMHLADVKYRLQAKFGSCGSASLLHLTSSQSTSYGKSGQEPP